MHKAEREGRLKLRVIHVEGSSVKSWDIDGLSRRNLMEGMMDGKDPLSLIPLAAGANNIFIGQRSVLGR